MRTASTLRRQVLRPDRLDWVTVRGIRVGDGRAALGYERSGGVTLVAVLRKEGDLRVTIDY